MPLEAQRSSETELIARIRADLQLEETDSSTLEADDIDHTVKEEEQEDARDTAVDEDDMDHTVVEEEDARDTADAETLSVRVCYVA